MEKNEGFSIPSVAEIKEANRIRTSSKPSLFEEKSLKKIGPNLPKISCSEGAIPPAVKISRAGVSKSGGASSSSSDNHQNKATPATYHPHAIIANAMQKSNPLMKYIRNVSWEVGDIVPDFELGKTTCALYISIRYHSLHPNYIHDRLKSLGRQYSLRVLLVHVDTSENQKPLKELAKIALLADLTLIVAWSYEEAARYLETYKAYENKPPDILKERIDSDFSSRVTECLTTVKKINKTDAGTLLNTFKTMEGIINSSKEDLTLCPGLGPQKAQRLHALFHEPFVRHKPVSS